MKGSIEEYIEKMSGKVKVLTETQKGFDIDRDINLNFTFYVSDNHDVLPDLRLQDFNIVTEAQQQIDKFLSRNSDSLAILIGPT
jgi:hypothetical protein